MKIERSAQLSTSYTSIASAIEKNRVHISQEQAEHAILLEKQKAKQLVEDNQVLQQRDRLLEITASAANIISTENNFDCALNKALRIIGEGIDTDRVLIAEYFDNPVDSSYLYWKIIYEWDSAYATSQLNHPEAAQGSYEGIEEWYKILSSGQSISYRLDEMPEPFRSIQAKVEVKMLHAVPIIVDGIHWGVLVIDDCCEEIHRSQAELNILKTAAACIGGAIERERSRCAKEEAEKIILLEREKAALEKTAQLSKHNENLAKRDRILTATAEAANALLTEETLNEGVNRALQIIGETLNTDRVTVIENWHNPSKPKIPHWRLLYEWNAPQIISQISHPELTQGSYEGIEEWYVLQSKGKGVSCKLTEMNEPFRSGQEKLGVKVLHTVPIFIEGKHWGIVGFDDCRQEINRSEAELSILKTVAACIGSAIEKERNRCAKEAAEKAILLEREKAALEKTVSLLKSNQILSSRDRWLEATANAANRLLKNADLEEGINAALKVLGESLDCDRVCVIQNIEDLTGESPGFMRCTHEWDSPFATPQIHHPEFNEFSNHGLEDWFNQIINGKDYVGGTFDELPEAYHSALIELEIQSTYNVPIFVGGDFWGILGIDYCCKPRRLTSPEIAVFKTAASCIGSTIYRQQIQQDKEQAELAVLDERNRMAREIHDTLAQAFTGISLQLEAAQNILFTQPEAAQERLLQAKKLAKEGITEARRSVRALRPKTLEFNDLAIALQQLVNNMTSGINIKAQVLIEGEPQLSSEIEADLYRIAQEAITNILRHAQATELTVLLTSHTDTVSLQIKDNGIGFEPQQVLNKVSNNSFGLIGMQERCDRHNGNLAIDSSGDRGTKIIASIPI